MTMAALKRRYQEETGRASSTRNRQYLIRRLLWIAQAAVRAPPTGDRALAALPGMVNMLNVNGTLIIPEPFFPEFTNGVLNSLGSVTIGWIDCREYHHNQGEVHCGTNVRRQPSIQAQAWWNIEP